MTMESKITLALAIVAVVLSSVAVFDAERAVSKSDEAQAAAFVYSGPDDFGEGEFNPNAADQDDAESRDVEARDLYNNADNAGDWWVWRAGTNIQRVDWVSSHITERDYHCTLSHVQFNNGACRVAVNRFGQYYLETQSWSSYVRCVASCYRR